MHDRVKKTQFKKKKKTDFKGKRYFYICRENFQFFFLTLDKFCVCNSYKSHKLEKEKFALGQRKHREFEHAI